MTNQKVNLNFLENQQSWFDIRKLTVEELENIKVIPKIVFSAGYQDWRKLIK